MTMPVASKQNTQLKQHSV